MKNPQIPAQLRQEIERRLAAGQPMPQGVVAVPAGQAPPPGAVPTGVVSPGVGMQGAAQHPGVNSKAAANPIGDGMEGIKLIRTHSECNIPDESKKLNTHLQVLLNTEGDHEVAEAAMGKGLFAGLKMNKHCIANLKTRTAVLFEKDEKLKDLTDQLNQAEKDAIATQKKLQEIAANAQQLLAERWTYAVKNFGLNPDKNFYRINEDKGIIEEVELRCDKCTAGQSMIDARLQIEEYLQTLVKKEEEENDGPREATSIESSGESPAPEQEVPSMADSTDADGSDGADSTD